MTTARSAVAEIKVKTGKLSYICRVDGVDASQIVLATPTIGEALDRPLVVEIIESRAHR